MLLSFTLQLLQAASTAPAVSVQSLPYRFGRLVSLCGDLDGDGHSEFAIGGAGFEAIPSGILVYSGKTGQLMRRVEPLVEGSWMGSGFCRTSDLDGDGVDDMATSAWWNKFKDGRVEIRSGKTGKLGRIISPAEGEHTFGIGICNVGDVDGDGVGDLVISTLRAPLGSPWEGMRWIVVAGATGKRLQTVDWRGPLEGDEWNMSQENPAAVSVGDTNGDGVPDFAIVDGLHVRVQSGRKSETLQQFDLPPRSPDEFGGRCSIAGLGDLDGDGHADIVIGTPFDQSYHPNQPLVVLREFSGLDGHLIRSFSRSGSLLAVGCSVASTHDRDGDGIRDMWVTECGYFDSAVWEISGRTGEVLKTVSSSNYDWMGSELVTGADVDGDGIDDFIAAAYSHEDEGSPFHGALVFSGKDYRTLFEKRAVRDLPKTK
jgi:hypothetical protein